MKDKLGGSRAFNNQKPTIDDRDSRKTFLGVPISAVKDWFRMVLIKEWPPRPFWEHIAKHFKVTKNEMSKYEDIHIRIQRLGLLIKNKERFHEILDKNIESRYGELCDITGMAWHPTKNSPAVERIYIEYIEKYLTIDFDEVKKQGTDALINYFMAIDGICFEDRARNIEEYARNNLLLEKIDDDVQFVADWSTENCIEDVYLKEAQQMALKNDGTAVTPSQLFDHLIHKGVFNLEFSTGDGQKSKPSFDGFNSWAKEQIELCILSEEDVAEIKPNKR